MHLRPVGVDILGDVFLPVECKDNVVDVVIGAAVTNDVMLDNVDGSVECKDDVVDVAIGAVTNDVMLGNADGLVEDMTFDINVVSASMEIDEKLKDKQ